MRLVVIGLLLLGCGQKARPAPAPAEQAVTGIASIAGEWVADDEMSWSYALAITADGTLTGKIDRGKLPRCERQGTLAYAGGRKFKLAMTKNTCEQAIANAGAAEVEVASFTGNALTLVVTTDGVAERRTYTRRPD
ncbi:MAG TPA: hypothetical protein VFO79_01030 [Xanthomonadales bacterium]|nr:hypothetical protein [Xanthomonadales bacterium]